MRAIENERCWYVHITIPLAKFSPGAPVHLTTSKIETQIVRSCLSSGNKLCHQADKLFELKCFVKPFYRTKILNLQEQARASEKGREKQIERQMMVETEDKQVLAIYIP